MRILHLTTLFPLDSKNVAGVFILELAKSLHNNNVDIEVLAPHAHNSKTHEKLDGVKVRRLRYFFPTKWQNLCYGSGMPVNIKSSYLARLQLPVLGLNFLIYILLRGKKYDLIHAHWNFAGLAAIIAGKIRKVPVVINIDHGQNRQEINRLDKFIIEKADSIVCNSRFNKDQIIKY